MKLPYTEVKFYPEVKSQTGLSSLRVSCKRALSRVKSNVAPATTKFWVESEYYLNLESENKKQYKKKSTLSNEELLSDPNVSISLLLICQ